MSIEERAKKIRLVIMDVDGVLTDGRIIYSDRGDELKCFNVKDGLGVRLLGRAGIKTAIITAKGSKVVGRRARDMEVAAVYKNISDKAEAYRNSLRKFRVSDEEACFIGDDIIDLPVLRKVGFAVAVSDAVEDVRQAAHYITKCNGGNGAVREVVDIILKAKAVDNSHSFNLRG